MSHLKSQKGMVVKHNAIYLFLGVFCRGTYRYFDSSSLFVWTMAALCCALFIFCWILSGHTAGVLSRCLDLLGINILLHVQVGRKKKKLDFTQVHKSAINSFGLAAKGKQGEKTRKVKASASLTSVWARQMCPRD